MGEMSDIPEIPETPRRRPGLRPERVGDGVILVDGTGAEVCVLNETAFALWQLCDGATSPSEISAAVSAAVGLDGPTARLEVTAALAELRRSGALV